MILTEEGFGDFLYNKIYYALRALYGESDHITFRHILGPTLTQLISKMLTCKICFS
jgi:hypothetical protein